MTSITSENQIPGFRELSDWPSEPKLPLRIKNFDSYRDPKPHCTFLLDLVDFDRTVYHFFFDRFLGRLLYGESEEDDEAAYLKKGSRLQIEVFAIIDELCRDRPEYAEVQRRLNLAKNYI